MVTSTVLPREARSPSHCRTTATSSCGSAFAASHELACDYRRASCSPREIDNELIRLKVAELVNQATIRGWDQRRLARACGVSEATISRALKGHAIRRDTLLRLVRALDNAPPIPHMQRLVEAHEMKDGRRWV